MMRRTWFAATTAAAILIATAPRTHAAPILSVTPASASIGVGGSATFDITITDAVDVYAYQFDIGFNPAALAATTVTEGGFLSTGGATFFIPGAIDNVGGTVAATANTLLTAVTGVDGDGVLATVTFDAVAPGSATLSLFNVFLLDSSLSALAFTTQTASVTVTGSQGPVPEPSTLALLVTGGALGARRILGRRRKSGR